MSTLLTDEFPITIEKLNGAESHGELAELICEVDSMMAQALDNEEMAVAAELASIQEKLLDILMDFPA